MDLGADARLLAVVGDPVAHSLSPRMQNAAIRAAGLAAVYVALRTPPESLPTVLDALRAVGAAGNVTVPHKEAAFRHVARPTDLARRAGACNTYWVEHGELAGDNTDVAGVLGALDALGARGGTWCVAGTGGSARAVALAAAERGATVLVRSRTPERARAFAAWAESVGVAARPAGAEARADVLINATPLGLRPGDPSPIPDAFARGARVALDLVYARDRTAWVRALRARGIAAEDGREVLVRQGAAAFARFFPGTPPPVEVMRAAVVRALGA